MKMRRLLVPAALLALGLLQAFDAAALGLARARGAVLIGRPLNVTIAATAEAGDPDVPCVEADVFMGDTRARRVNVRWEGAAGGAGNIRVTTDGVVDEPIVTIYVRVGCANKVTRRYVLLPEEPMDQAQQPASVPAQVMATPVVPPAGRATPAPAAIPAPVAPPPAVAAGRVPAADPLRIQPAPRIAPKASSASTSRRQARTADATAPSKAARLKLDPLDLVPERDPSLRASGRLQNEPVADEERRRQAAAMWKALSAGPEEAMRNGERIAVLEKDVRALSELMRKNTAALELMRDQTLKARSERNVVAIVAVILALLIAAAAIAWAWMRTRSAESRPAWWGSRRMREAADSDFASELNASAPPARKPAVKPPTVPPTTPPDIDLDSTPPAPPPPPAPRRARAGNSVPPRFSASSRFQTSDFQASIPGSSRMMKAEELIDIQQQADFFLSIDQPDRAIALLESHIHQDQETSALAWMDLLEIYHDLGREEDYDRIREDFHERFNAQVPAMEAYSREQGGLENYSRAMSRIVSLWPSRRVLEVIEESLLRKPGSADSEAFDLEAYRELVLLYNIGREVAQDFDESAAELPRISPNFGETTAMSLSAVQGFQPSEPPAVSPAQMPWPSDHLGLDIDLGDFSSLPPGPPTAPPKPKNDSDNPTDLDQLDWRSLR